MDYLGRNGYAVMRPRWMNAQLKSGIAKTVLEQTGKLFQVG